jgi:hypothetical protein
VIEFHFRGPVSGRRQWWLVLSPEDADVCDSDPGFGVAVVIDADLRAMVDVWLGNTTWNAASNAERIRVEAAPTMQQALPHWFQLSGFAGVPRATVTS